MKIIVDLNKCSDHGECVAAAPEVFSLNNRGELSFRSVASDTFVSPDLDESLRNDLLDAVDNCPMQAIDLEG